MTDFLKIAKSIAVHFAHICAYGVETVNAEIRLTKWEDPINDLNAFRKLAQSSLQAQVPRHDFSTIDN